MIPERQRDEKCEEWYELRKKVLVFNRVDRKYKVLLEWQYDSISSVSMALGQKLNDFHLIIFISLKTKSFRPLQDGAENNNALFVSNL